MFQFIQLFQALLEEITLSPSTACFLLPFTLTFRLFKEVKFNFILPCLQTPCFFQQPTKATLFWLPAIFLTF